MRKKKILIVLLLVLTVMSLSGCGDEDTEDPFDFSEVVTKDINPWDYVEDTSISMNGALTSLAASSSELGITIGIMGMVFSIFYMVIRISFSRSAATKEEVKHEAVLKGLVGIMLFSIPFWLGLFKQFAELLV